ncbi:uncharacterized protein METZ01_LOCUS355432, partial [marine metagenome]
MSTNEKYLEHKEKARVYLSRFKEHPLGHFIDGKHHHTGKPDLLDNICPVDGSLINQIEAGSTREVNLAAEAAREAFPGWRDMAGNERKKILNQVADLIVERSEEISLIECVDTGQPHRFMSKAAIRGAENYRFFADKAPEANNGLSLPADNHINYTLRSPIGPVGIITPWNTPFMLSTWKIAPALAAGCTVVHKPAEWSPLTAMLLA